MKFLAWLYLWRKFVFTVLCIHYTLRNIYILFYNMLTIFLLIIIVRYYYVNDKNYKLGIFSIR